VSVTGWESVDELDTEGRSLSRQRARLRAAPVAATEEGAAVLGTAYWRAVRRSTFGAVRPHWTPHAGELRLLGLLPLLRFGPAELRAEPGSVSFRCEIRGGLLAAGAGGHVRLEQREREGGAELVATVDEYRPRLAGLLHRRVQRPFHLAVSRRWLRSLAREPR
jgi:hypothetical protein